MEKVHDRMKKETSKAKRLNLGCGKDIKKGYINLDKAKYPGVDVIHDIDIRPWPFKSDYFDEVYCRDCIEHVKDLFKSMMEIKRVCKDNAIVRIIVPYWHSSGAFYPHHHYFFNVDTMKFFTAKDRVYDSYYGFKMEKIVLFELL